MASLRKFLIIDEDLNTRFLFSKTLLRYYPNAMVQECQDLNTATKVVRSLPVTDNNTVVIAHRAVGADGLQVVSALRAVHATIPIVWTGELSQASRAQSIGATRCLDERAWLMIGQTVKDLI